MRYLVFLVLNFVALGIGGWFTGPGVSSDWYAELNKAPWTPAGWVFGAAWTTIMVCFGIYMGNLWKSVSDKKFLIILYGLQWVLNVSWNPFFFHFRWIGFGLLVIVLLTCLMGYFLFRFRAPFRWNSLLVAPYFLWLLVATSLNTYIALFN